MFIPAFSFPSSSSLSPRPYAACRRAHEELVALGDSGNLSLSFSVNSSKFQLATWVDSSGNAVEIPFFGVVQTGAKLSTYGTQIDKPNDAWPVSHVLTLTLMCAFTQDVSILQSFLNLASLKARLDIAPLPRDRIITPRVYDAFLFAYDLEHRNEGLGPLTRGA